MSDGHKYSKDDDSILLKICRFHINKFGVFELTCYVIKTYAK